MNRKVSNPHVKRPVSRETIHPLIALMALLAALVGVAGCQPISNPTTAATQEPDSSGVASRQLTATPSTSSLAAEPDQRPADVAQDQYLRFGHLTTEHGLSNNAIWGIAQDSYGFIWIATYAGLNRYDGSEFKVYRHNPDDPNSISHDAMRGLIVDQTGVLWIGTWGGGLNRFDHKTDSFTSYQNDADDPHSLSNDNIRTIYEDRGGMIWVGTMGGLTKLDPATMQFTQYLHDPDDPTSLGNNIVWSVYEDSAGVLWIGTEGGLDRFDPGTEQFVHYRSDPDDPSSLNNNSVRSISEDRSGTLWVGTMGGLGRFNRETEQFSRYQHDSANPDSLSHNVIFLVYQDRAGNLWIGTWGGGLDRFDPETETFIHYRSNPADPYSLGSDNVYLIFEDQAGMFWIGTEDAGINFLDLGAKPFRHYRSIPGNPNSLSQNGVRSIYEDRAGAVWVGTTSGGLDKLDRQTGQFTHYLHDPEDPNSLSNDSVIAIHEDREGILWAGGFGSGLNRFDRDAETFTQYRHDAANPQSLSSDSIVSIHEDRSGTLWIGTWGGGLNAFDLETEQFTRYLNDPADPASLSHNQVVAIYEDHESVLWIGTVGGLNRFDPETETFTRYQHVPTDPASLGQDSVVTLHEDRSGNLWIGTTGGLDRFDRETERFDHFTVDDGLSSNLIFGILEDDVYPDGEGGSLWLSTSSGLSKFNRQTETFDNFDVSDGLQSNTFMTFNAYYKAQSGELFFGGANGFNAFYPDQIVDNSHAPPIVITDFRLANKPVPIGGDSVLQKSILETDQLVLSYEDRVFSFEFAALNFRSPEKNLYKYKMEGFEEDWSEVDSARRFATYTNLDPGDYVFRVIGSNNDGVWNEAGASLRITVTPPWWETLWFRIGLAVMVVGLLVGWYRRRVSSVEARSRELQAQVEERTQQLLIAKEAADEARAAAETANRAKSMFLANMSHELRTPLNAILGFARLMARDPAISGQQEEMLDVIDRSGEHLLDMVDDVLSLSRIESGRVELQQEAFDVVDMLMDIGHMIKSRAGGKGLQFDLELDAELAAVVHGDAGKLRQVLINLLGNAIKFTTEGGVWLRARSQPLTGEPGRVMLEVEVEDTGPGIPSEQIDRVFEAFVQGEQFGDGREGTGLGLTISRRLVEIMGGELAVDSEVGRGSLFRVRVPMQLAEAQEATPEVPVARVIGLQADQPAWRILVVDDNLENRLLLASLLTRVGFSVQEAENGEEAIASFEEWHPHLIWMDMRMPVMDGYVATPRIRALPGGDVVRIAAVTASAFEEQREEILACGCDDLVGKPFREHKILEVMARLLGVGYVYEQVGEEPVATPEADLTAEMLAHLLPDLIAALDEATLALDREASLQVIERIAEQAPETARGLRQLVEDLQMGRIRELLAEMRQRNDR